MLLTSAPPLAPPVTLLNTVAGNVPLTVKAAPSQSANLQEWQSSTGSVLASVRSDGAVQGVYFQAPGNSTGGYITTSATSPLIIQAPNGTAIPLVIKTSVPSYTADLLQFQSSTAAVLAKVAADGAITTPKLSIAGGGIPTVAANAGLGTAPTISVAANSTDEAGLINFTVGTTPSGGSQFTVTFSATFTTAPRYILIGFQGANGGTATVSSITTAGFTVSSAGFTAGATYGITYLAIF